MLDPNIFQRTRRHLRFNPGVYLFASNFHHQLQRYCAVEDDPKAAGKDAFKANWLVENNPYINPPWLLIPKCLENIIADQVVVMFVVPKWEDAKWWPRYCDLCLRHIELTEAVFLSADLTLWKKSIRDTRIGILDGTRHTREPRPCAANTHQRAPVKGNGKH